MTILYFIRHGQSIGNLEGNFLGHTDLDLSGLGYRQAELTGKYFNDIEVDRVYSSDLSRALHTVEPIAKRHSIEVIPDKMLREVYSGKWENYAFDRLITDFPDDYGRWLTNIGSATCTDGETVAHMQQRVNANVRKIAAANDGKSIVIGTHATPIRAMTCIWRGWPLSRMKEIGWVPNASVTKVIFDGEWHIEQYGYNGHLGNLTSALGKNV